MRTVKTNGKFLFLKAAVVFVFVSTAVFILNGCAGSCTVNSTGTITVKNNTNDTIKVEINGISYGYVNMGDTLTQKNMAAGITYEVGTFWPNGSVACSAAGVAVAKCESQGIECSAVH